MALHENEIAMARKSLPEYLTLAKLGVDRGGLGCPTATVLFAVIDSIGSCHRKHPTFTVRVGDADLAITQQDHHLRILNAPYFGGNNGCDLTTVQINRIYRLARSPLTHNAVVGSGCLLWEGSPARPAIEELDGVIHISLPALLKRCAEAVDRFLPVADQIIPVSLAGQDLRDLEDAYGGQIQAAMARLDLSGLQSMPVTGMQRP